MIQVVLIALVLLVPTAVLAQGDGVASEVTAEARRMAEFQELLEANDMLIRDAAVERALRDASPAIRGIAIHHALRRYPTLPLAFAIPPGSPLANEATSSLTLTGIKWSANGRAFAADAHGCRGWAEGQIAGDTLRIQLTHVCLQTDPDTSSHRPGANRETEVLRRCEVELRPSQSRDALQGMLRCPGRPSRYPVSLPLG